LESIGGDLAACYAQPRQAGVLQQCLQVIGAPIINVVVGKVYLRALGTPTQELMQPFPQVRHPVAGRSMVTRSEAGSA